MAPGTRGKTLSGIKWQCSLSRYSLFQCLTLILPGALCPILSPYATCPLETATAFSRANMSPCSVMYLQVLSQWVLHHRINYMQSLCVCLLFPPSVTTWVCVVMVPMTAGYVGARFPFLLNFLSFNPRSSVTRGCPTLLVTSISQVSLWVLLCQHVTVKYYLRAFFYTNIPSNRGLLFWYFSPETGARDFFLRVSYTIVNLKVLAIKIIILLPIILL